MDGADGRTHPDLTHAAALFAGPPITRFAPSPTGYLHLGHVVNAIYVWGVARALGGRVVLRIEDHDRIRSRPEYERAIVSDLEWLGFEPAGGLDPLHRQSDHAARYEQALEQLRATAHVYACGCSRKEIGGEHYPATCRHRGVEDAAGRGIRVAIDDRPEHFVDLLQGPLGQVPADQCGDLLLRDRDGHWTYQFAVTVDDLWQGIDLVVRGADLLSSTGRQIKLARMLGRAVPPRYLHHPLIVKGRGEKLSKASGDSGVRELRRAGIAPAEVIGRAAAAVGLLPRPRPLPASAVGELFGN
jgi:glutamyl-tRNA synthetase/glutamyl-Q tRNA(Asp) synthetase